MTDEVTKKKTKEDYYDDEIAGKLIKSSKKKKLKRLITLFLINLKKSSQLRTKSKIL